MFSSNSFTVAVGTPLVIPIAQYRVPLSITAIPGSGGTMTVEISSTPTAVANPGSANWIAWSPGSVSAATESALFAPRQALRCTALVQAGTVELGS